MSTGRLYNSTPDLDAAELAWWRKFADIEERFCWVQTPPIQRFLRGRYVREMISTVPRGARIAELGCGAGWLAILLAQLGASEVVGIDFSPEQIEKARSRSFEMRLGNRVRFEVGSVSDIAGQFGKFQLIVVHGFLHHLATTEIIEVLNSIHRSLAPGGHLIIWEPVQYPNGQTAGSTERWQRSLLWLKNVPNRGQRWGLRKCSEAELRVRNLIAERSITPAPRGPSPKEIPFAPGEIQDLVDPLFRVMSSRRCMAGSLKVAEEVLLLRLSHPWFSRILLWPLLLMARFAERRLLRQEKEPRTEEWIFEMFDCIAKEHSGIAAS